MFDPTRPLRGVQNLCERRAGRQLRIWGDLGVWLVVDDEAGDLIDRFDAPRAPDAVCHALAKETGRDPGAVCAEVLPVVESLAARGILSDGAPIAPLPEEPPTFANLTYNITDRCNLSCPWCYNAPPGGAEADPEAVADWIRDGASALAPDASLFILGGEPLLDPGRLFAFLRRVRDVIPDEVLVSTNGTRMDAATARGLAALKLSVQVSIDSPFREAHDAVRGAGVFDKALGALACLNDAGVHTIMSMVLTKQTAEYLEAYFDLGLERGADEVRFIPLRALGGGEAYTDARPDLPAVFERLAEILERRPECRSMLRRDFFTILASVCRFTRLRDNCGIGRRVLFVDAAGDLYPCPNHRQVERRIGSIRDLPLTGVLATPVMQLMRETYHTARCLTCRDCAFRHWCAGDCRAEAEALGGAGAPSPYCAQLRRLIPRLMWTLAQNASGLGREEVKRRSWV